MLLLLKEFPHEFAMHFDFAAKRKCFQIMKKGNEDINHLWNGICASVSSRGFHFWKLFGAFYGPTI